jgi:D-glycero-alpha-D-manno-heptose-7-phosphate kinase
MPLISLYAYATIEPLEENSIVLETNDRNEKQVFELISTLPLDGKLDLLKGVYNCITRDYVL